MVENQHGLGSVLSFSAKSVSPKILEALLVGREKIVDQLENRVKNISNDGLNHQVLIVGARGTGKTHMLSVLHNRIQPQIEKGKIKVAYFAEEEYGISDYLDFMVRILNAFIRWNEEDAEFLKNQLSVLQETPNSQQEDTIQRIIREYIDKKPLLILAENFNDILSAIKKDGQSKLRNWLQDNNRISVIATSQALSDDIGKEDKPFYGFFDEINIKPLTLEQSFKLLKSLAKLEKREDVVEHLENKGKSQVMAINTLVKGNHRLLITFYQFLKSDVLSNLSVMFIKTLNDLKPYYETFIRYQQPQQQKIIRYLALSKTPRQGTEIARECFIDQKSLSKQMSELARKKLVDVITDPDDKRNKLYDISEPLLRISIEIGEHKEGISALFIDFLALYYNQVELKNQMDRFSEIFNHCADPKEKQQYSFEILAREKALKLQDLKLKNKTKQLIAFYQNLKESIDEKDHKKALDIFIKIGNSIENKNHDYYDALSGLHLLNNQNDKALEFFYKSLELNPKNKHVFNFTQRILFKVNGFDKWKKVLEKIISFGVVDYNIYVTLGSIYVSLKNKRKAVKFLSKAIKLNSTEPVSKLLTIMAYDLVLPQKNINYYYDVLLKSKELFDDIDYVNFEVLNTLFLAELKYDTSLDVRKSLELEKIILEEFENPKELQISLEFIKTYRMVILEKKQKALYNLPKEQREFFKKEILDIRKKLK